MKKIIAGAATVVAAGILGVGYLIKKKSKKQTNQIIEEAKNQIAVSEQSEENTEEENIED